MVCSSREYDDTTRRNVRRTRRRHNSVRYLVELVRAAANQGSRQHHDQRIRATSGPGQRSNGEVGLLGCVGGGEDVVKGAYGRWYGMSQQQQKAIESPGAWLTTVASRICLDLLGSARARRERYVGEWIPEPLPERTEWISGRSGNVTVGPADRVTLHESVNIAF